MILFLEPPKITLNTLSKIHDPVRALRKLRTAGFKNAIIAGGAIRDLYANKFISEYDIFLWDPDESHNTDVYTFSMQSNLDSTFNGTINSILISKILNIPVTEDDGLFGSVYIELNDSWETDIDSFYSGENTCVTQIWNISYGMTSYKLIFLNKDPLKFFDDNFHLGICRAYCDGNKIHCTSDFLKDMRNDTITIRNTKLTKEHFDYMIEYHLQNVRYKYPGFKVIIHPNLVQFVDDDNQHYIT